MNVTKSLVINNPQSGVSYLDLNRGLLLLLILLPFSLLVSSNNICLASFNLLTGVNATMGNQNGSLTIRGSTGSMNWIGANVSVVKDVTISTPLFVSSSSKYAIKTRN